ncbi:hypothetical protein AB0L00_00605 [Actinoallomurus sp. NPDC052308]|uniref:hypothetical protein n=1 Tax=Actinoallomurus sp. NPDC052308 TaxID=3155530 RepID=UPI00343B75B1
MPRRRWSVPDLRGDPPARGMGRDRHLDDALAALELRLTDDEITRLEKPYTPHAVAGF